MISQTPVKIYVSDTFDPWFNLATEDWIFRDRDPHCHVLFLWRNSDTVVIGRFQNPWTECHTQKMEQDGIKLARRQSGGGAVYHDLGNTNFTFMSSKESYSKQRNNLIITEALKEFGIMAYASGRNDICVDESDGPRKISGSAFKETKERSFHHGTLLINADLSKLGNYLNPDKKKLVSKGITSVRSRVANLSQYNPLLTHESLCERVIEKFLEAHGARAEVEVLNNEYLRQIPKLNEYYNKLKDWQWRFGETPQFSHQMEQRFEWGNMEVHLDAQKGLIKNAKIFSDSLHPDMVQELMNTLKDALYSKQAILDACEAAAQKLTMYKDEIKEFSSWLVQEIS